MKALRSKLPLAAPAMLALAAAALISPALAQASGPVTEQSRVIRIAAAPGAAPQRLSLAVNNAAILELDRDVRDVFIANPEIADAVVRTPRRIFLMSLKVGRTNAILLDSSGQQIAALDIAVGADVASLNEQIAVELPGTTAKAQALQDSIVLSGSVNSVVEASRAEALARGMVSTPEKVVNNLSIDERQQVLIQVRVTEMSRNISKQLGINAATAFTVAGVPIVASTDNQFSLIGRALADLSGISVGDIPPNNVQAQLQALERIGLVRTLAEPNLTAISGEAARFLAGGEFPVPVGRDRDGNITIEYKQFGVGLAFTPVVLSKGRISLQISTEVSELTNTGALTLAGGVRLDENGNPIITSGVTLPALSVRRTETTVELPSGGSLAIGGLIQQQTKQNLDAFPGLKDLPVLGALFRSRDFQNNESELVVTVSAYLVNPVAPTQLARPDDGFVLPTDLETILLGRLNAVYGRNVQLPPGVPREAVGYILP